MSESWLFNFYSYLYALSCIFALAFFFSPQPRLKVLTKRFTIVLWGLQTLFVLLSVAGILSFIGLQTYFLYSWSLLSFALLIMLVTRLEVLLVFANVLGLLIWISYSIRFDTDFVIVHKLELSNWIFFHVISAMVAYAALSLSSICAGMYLLSHYLLKRKKGLQLLRLLPSLGQLQAFAFRFGQMGIFLLFIALLQGTIFAYRQFSTTIFSDPKTISSILVLLLYSFVLLSWKQYTKHCRKMAWWNFTLLFIIFVNYLFLDTRFSFHSWMIG